MSYIPLGPFEAAAGRSISSPTPETHRPQRLTATAPRSSWRRAARFYGLTVTSVMSIALLALNQRRVRIRGSITSQIAEHQATTQLIVQVIAGLAGMVLSSAICELINNAIRQALSSRKMKLNTLHFWISVTQDRLDWNVTPTLLGPLVLFCILTLVPAALWAGAMAPVSTKTTLDGRVRLAAYDSFPDADSIGNVLYHPAEVVDRKFGSFTYSVGMNLHGQLINSAESATPSDNSTVIRRKLDNLQYVYHGRSYGVGATIAMPDSVLTESNYTAYSFQEIGYVPNVKCIYNDSSAYALVPNIANYTTGASWWSGYGTLPNTNTSYKDFSESDPFVGMYGSTNIVAYGTTHWKPLTFEYYVAIAAGRNYGFLNNIQCKFSFAPARFNASVVPATRIITVRQSIETETPADISPTHDVQFWAMRQFAAISHQSIAWDMSPIGASLSTNVRQYGLAHNLHFQLGPGSTSDTNYTRDPALLPAVQASMEATIDDILVGLGGAQAVMANDTQTVPAAIEVWAIEFGQAIYILAIFIVNAIVVLLVVLQGCFSSFWRHLPLLDCLDPRTMILAAWRSGSTLQDVMNADSVDSMQVKLTRTVGQDEALHLVSGVYDGGPNSLERLRVPVK